MKYLFSLFLILLFANVSTAQKSVVLNSADVRGNLQIPRFATLPTYGRVGAIVYVYAGADSGIYIRRTNATWLKINGATGGGGTYTAGNGIKALGATGLQSGIIRWADTIAATTLFSSGNFILNTHSTTAGIDRGSLRMEATQLLINKAGLDYSNTLAFFDGSVRLTVRSGLNTGGGKQSIYYFGHDSIKFTQETAPGVVPATVIPYWKKVNPANVGRYWMMMMDSSSGAMVTARLDQVSSPGIDTTSISDRINSKVQELQAGAGVSLMEYGGTYKGYIVSNDTAGTVVSKAFLANELDNRMNVQNVPVQMIANAPSFTANDIRELITATGTTVSIAGAEMNVAGIATVATTNTTNIPIDLNADSWTFVVRVRANVTGGTMRFGIGTRISNFRASAGTNKSVSATYDMSTGADRGKLFFFSGANAVFTQRAVTAAGTVNNGDTIEITLTRAAETFYFKAKNITLNDSVTGSYVYSLAATTDPVLPGTSRPALYNLHQSDVRVLSMSFATNLIQRPYLLVVGDSKSVGYNATAIGDAYVNQLRAAHPDSVVSFSGFGDEVGDAIKWLSLIRQLRPQNVLIAIGSNDRRNNVTDPVLLDNLEKLRDACLHVNAKIFGLVMSENAVNQSVLIHQYKQMFGADNTMVISGTLAGDGVHLTTSLHNSIFTAVNAKIF